MQKRASCCSTTQESAQDISKSGVQAGTQPPRCQPEQQIECRPTARPNVRAMMSSATHSWVSQDVREGVGERITMQNGVMSQHPSACGDAPIGIAVADQRVGAHRRQSKYQQRRDKFDEVSKSGAIFTRICEERPTPLQEPRCQSILMQRSRFNRHTCAPMKEPMTTAPATAIATP